MAGDKKLKRIEDVTKIRGIRVVTFPYFVKVDKQLFDAKPEVNKNLKSYDSFNDSIAEQGIEICTIYTGPARLPFYQVDIRRREGFKTDHLTASDDTSYTFKLVNWCRINKILSQETTADGKQVVTISGSYYEQAISSTEWIMDPSDHKGTFTFDAKGNFLSCSYNGHSSDEVAGTEVLYE